MIRRITYTMLIILFFVNNIYAQIKNQFYFDKPASIWEESFPLGNGRIGMMPWGGVELERFVLNEISLWSGNKQESDNPEAHKYLSEIRNLLFQKRNREAQELMYKTFTCLGRGSEENGKYGNYQNFGNIYTQFFYPDSSLISDYKRSLDLNNAISQVSFKKGDVTYSREFFTSFNDDIGVVKYSSDKPNTLSFKLWLQRDERSETSVLGDILEIKGQLKDDVKNEGMKYLGQVKLLKNDGTVRFDKDTLIISGASDVVLLVSMATSYNGVNPQKEVSCLQNNIKSAQYDTLKSEHTKKYQHFFNRVDLNLPQNINSDLPIDQRLKAFSLDNTDLDLVSLYMQYGRYLLISSTREGGLPPNLQGLWAPQIYTPWNGDYHLNINLQMNLWGAEVGNLSELHNPLIDYVKSISILGENTAKVYYDSRGWVTHILGNVWGFTSPSEDPSWGATNTAGAWLCQHLWEHYLYTQDINYLRSVYPVMKGAALFFSDMLIEDPNNGYLVTAPTTSPENKYVITSGDTLSISAGSTMDNQIIRELFTNVIDATSILNIDSELRQELTFKKSKLASTSVGKHGQIMEWLEDYDEADAHHRHVSQLYGLYPGYEMTYDKTPALMEASKTTLNRRGDYSTGWSMAWKIAFWSRLKDGNRAFKLFSDLLNPAEDGAGTYPNLFSAHPPMQIDGNFGGSAAIMEMLLQSHAGYIEFIPALPSIWKDGGVKGLKVRGGAEVDFKWKDGFLSTATLRAIVKNDFKIKIPQNANIEVLTPSTYKYDGEYLSVSLKKNEVCTINITQK